MMRTEKIGNNNIAFEQLYGKLPRKFSRLEHGLRNYVNANYKYEYDFFMTTEGNALRMRSGLRGEAEFLGDKSYNLSKLNGPNAIFELAELVDNAYNHGLYVLRHGKN